jgi:uncharacterized RDD family membrane protein YckC
MTYISVGRRFAALLLDWIILLAVAATMAEYETGDGSLVISWQGWRFVLAWIVVPLAYVVLFESRAGATPGKFIVGIRVRTEAGSRIGFGQSLGRNLARVVDAFPYVIPYLVGGIAVLRSSTRQRLGDRWASTVVIAKGTDAGPESSIGPPTTEPAWTAPLPPPPPPPPGI